jgi:hypothetical protein
VWDLSAPANIRYTATEDLGNVVPKGSVFEINKQDKSSVLQPIYCTVHLCGSSLKLYLGKQHVKALQDKLELIKT